VCTLAGSARESVPLQEYRQRRDAVRQALPDGVVVLFGRTDRETDDSRNGFFQQPGFYYLTGWNEPGAAILLAPATDGKTSPADVLFLPARDGRRERYHGRQLNAADPNAHEVTGFDRVLPIEKLESEVGKALEDRPKLYTLLTEAYAAQLKQLAPLREIASAQSAITNLRMKKSPAELALIQKATDATIEGFRTAWKRAAPGLYEYQIAAAMQSVYFDKGCERNAYAPIVATGQDATVLHYATNSHRIEPGDLVLMDVGAEFSLYSADLTRTIPATGKFSARQRELYEIVLGAQKAVIAAVKPGMVFGTNASTPNSLWKIAFDYIESHGKDRDGKALGQRLLHGVSHSVGLEVHDDFPPGQPLEPGMVITVEPGIYIPEEGIGIRIEDMLLVTGNGARVLSTGLPKEPDEVERAMAR
jgi:Xaa-Pro aminopeptidase